MSSLGPGGTLKPPTPKPIYPDTPWWSNLVTAVVVATVSILGTAYALGGLKPPTGTSGIPGGGAIGIVTDTITYMPHILLLFGVLADMFTYEGVWSIPSLVGLLSIFVNYFMQYFWKGLAELFDTAKNVASVGSSTYQNPEPVAPPQENPFRGGKRGGAIVPPAFFTNYDGCSIQGFGSLRTEYAPQTLVVTATVFCYYIFDLVRNRGWLNATGAIVGFGAFYVAQAGVLSMTGGCGGIGSDLVQAMRALFEGIVFGGTAYGVVQTYYPNRLPSAVISPFPTKSKNDLTAGPDGRMYDADGYPYVVLPNGQAVPDMSTKQARDAFAQLAGQNLGTGTPAGCSAK